MRIVSIHLPRVLKAGCGTEAPYSGPAELPWLIIEVPFCTFVKGLFIITSNSFELDFRLLRIYITSLGLHFLPERALPEIVITIVVTHSLLLLVVKLPLALEVIVHYQAGSRVIEIPFTPRNHEKQADYQDCAFHIILL